MEENQKKNEKENLDSAFLIKLYIYVNFPQLVLLNNSNAKLHAETVCNDFQQIIHVY